MAAQRSQGRNLRAVARRGDRRIDGLPPHRTVAEGLAHVLERRRLFPFLTVLDNLLLGAHNARARARRAETLARIDEPFLGLAPRVVQEIGGVIRRIRDEEGITVVFIEQNVELALNLANRGYILESGRTLLEGTAADLLQSPEVRRIFLGDVAL